MERPFAKGQKAKLAARIYNSLSRKDNLTKHVVAVNRDGVNVVREAVRWRSLWSSFYIDGCCKQDVIVNKTDEHSDVAICVTAQCVKKYQNGVACSARLR